MGTAFSEAGGKKGGDKKKTGCLLDEEWNALSNADEVKLRKECEDAKEAREAANKKPSKSKDNNEKSTLGGEKAILFCWQIVLLFVLSFVSRPAIFVWGRTLLQFEWHYFAHSFIFEWGKFDTIH